MENVYNKKEISISCKYYSTLQYKKCNTKYLQNMHTEKQCLNGYSIDEYIRKENCIQKKRCNKKSVLYHISYKKNHWNHSKKRVCVSTYSLSSLSISLS